ncbi:hypothetical protein [[Ruminococcus] torques]|uniref:hypothetical protein n=1 Tax=[Ruminococcus] torques TaxID=33039 RepID=UPI003AB622BE
MNVVFFVVALSSLTWRYGVWGGRRVAIQNNPSVCCGILINEKTVALKGIAAILIMLGHCSNALNMDGKYSFLNVGWYCVALFFFLSGYGILWRQ